jgi:hypothetical protein
LTTLLLVAQTPQYLACLTRLLHMSHDKRHIYEVNVGPFSVLKGLGNCTLGEDVWLKFISCG